MFELFLLVIGALLVNNFVLARFLGICPFLGVSRKVETAVGMGMAVIFVMTVASVVVYCVESFLLVPLGLEYLETIAFILIIAALVQFVEMVIQKTSPVLYRSLGIYLPLITTNCAVLGVAILSVQREFSFVQSAVFGAAASSGFTLALVLFAGLRERIALARVPAVFKGAPISLITAGLLSLAFMGFSGLVK